MPLACVTQISGKIGKARDLARSKFAIRADYFDKKAEYCFKNVRNMKDARLIGMTLDEKLGGSGVSVLNAFKAIEETAKSCALSAQVLADSEFGLAPIVMDHGSEAQRQFIASKIIQGHGTAVGGARFVSDTKCSNLPVKAIREGENFRLQGTLPDIRGANSANVLLIFADIVDPSGRSQQIGAFLVSREPQSGSFPRGMTIRERAPSEAQGLRGLPKADIQFDEVEIDAGLAVIPKKGTGFQRSLVLSELAACTVALGIAEAALHKMKQQFVEKLPASRPLLETHSLAHLASCQSANLYEARLELHALIKSGLDNQPTTKLRQARFLLLETCVKCVDDIYQLCGGTPCPASADLDRLYRDIHELSGDTANIALLRRSAEAPVYLRARVARKQISLPAFLEAAE